MKTDVQRKLKRFNSSVQHEWLDYSLVGLDDILEANLDLTTWLVKYNSYRPHKSLDNLTPLEYATKNFFQVLPSQTWCYLCGLPGQWIDFYRQKYYFTLYNL